MSEHKPDKWVILKIKTSDSVLYKVMGGWYGGYIGSDTWRINSGITKVELDGDIYKFHGSSGSIYLCNKNNYGMTVLMGSVLPVDDRLEVLEDSDFTGLLDKTIDRIKQEMKEMVDRINDDTEFNKAIDKLIDEDNQLLKKLAMENKDD